MTHSETILVVDDDLPIRRLMCRMLATAGYHVMEATDGKDARAIAVDHPHHIDLLITDVVMSGMDGFDLYEELTDRHPETAVLFISGYAHHVAVRGGLKEIQRPFLLKPFTSDELLEAVRGCLPRSDH